MTMVYMQVAAIQRPLCSIVVDCRRNNIASYQIITDQVICDSE